MVVITWSRGGSGVRVTVEVNTFPTEPLIFIYRRRNIGVSLHRNFLSPSRLEDVPRNPLP